MKYIRNKFLRTILYFPRNFYRTIKSCVLCLRFPFLYPRNRFTGLHYNNWKILDKIVKLSEEGQKAITTRINEPGYEDKLIFATIIYDNKKVILSNILKWIHNNPLQWLHFIPTWNELEAMPTGWRKKFGIQMCKDIKAELKQHKGAMKRYRITQIKEKFGGLRWYDERCPEKIFREIIPKYEKLSYETCICCGKPATCISAGYVSPYCDDCKSPDVRQNYVPITEEDAWDKAYSFYWPKENEE